MKEVTNSEPVKKTKKERKEEKKLEKLEEKQQTKSSKLIKKLIVFTIIIAIIGGLGYLYINNKNKPSKYDNLAQCLTQNGTKMFGAYWCPHCLNQKKEFGNSWKYIKYIECSLPGGQAQTQECNDEGIESYPTWEFADKIRLTGEIPLEQLAEKSNCEYTLPNK